MTISFECRTSITAPLETVFDLSLSIDAHLESMTGSKERAIGGVTSGTIGHGEQVRRHHEAAATPQPANPSTEVDRLVRAMNDSAPEHLRKVRP